MPRSDTIGNVHFTEHTITELAELRSQSVPDCNAEHLRTCDPGRPGGDPKWYGGLTSWADAKAVLDNGWVVGADRAMAIKDQILAAAPMLPKVRRNRRRQAWGAVGHTLNVDRAMAGQWDHAWRSTRREQVVGGNKCITLTVGWGGNCHRTAEQLFWSGATMLVLADILTTAGYSVRINAVCKVKSNAERSKLGMHRVVIKDHGEPLRPDALAGIVCHAGIFRTYGFLAFCHAPWNIGWGHGRMVQWKDAQKTIERTPDWYDDNEIVVGDCYSKAEAIAEATKVLTRFA